MADFKPIYDVTLKKEGGYQNNASDSGNYCYSYINGVRTRGALIGTNHGISAVQLQIYLGRCPSVAEMKALTPETAYLIYKKNFWDKISGDNINNQAVAKMIFTMFIQIGNVVKIRKAINKVSQEQFKKKLMYEKGMTPVVKNWQYEITPSGVTVINSLPAQKVFDSVKKELNDHYVSIKNTAVGKRNYNGWINRLSQITFTETDKKMAGIGFFLQQ